MKKMTKNKLISMILAVMNLIAGLYLFIDSFIKIKNKEEIFYFDTYLSGSLRVLPFILAISMILVSGPLFFRRLPKYLLHTYINAFIFILFFMPSYFYKDIKEINQKLLMLSQYISLFISLVLLFSRPDKENSLKAQNIKTKMTYEEYKDSLKKMKAYKEEAEEPIQKESIFGEISSYLKFKDRKKEIRTEDEDEIITESSELKNAEAYLQENYSKLSKDEQIKLTDEILEGKLERKDKELALQVSETENESTTQNSSIKLPDDRRKKGLKVQDSKVELTDDDVKIIEDKSELKDIIKKS